MKDADGKASSAHAVCQLYIAAGALRCNCIGTGTLKVVHFAIKNSHRLVVMKDVVCSRSATAPIGLMHFLECYSRQLINQRPRLVLDVLVTYHMAGIVKS